MKMHFVPGHKTEDESKALEFQQRRKDPRRPPSPANSKFVIPGINSSARAPDRRTVLCCSCMLLVVISSWHWWIQESGRGEEAQKNTASSPKRGSGLISRYSYLLDGIPCGRRSPPRRRKTNSKRKTRAKHGSRQRQTRVNT